MPRLTLLLALLLLSAVLQAAPQIQSWTTSKGSKVLFVPAPGLPMLDLRVVFDAGSARDGDRPGLALITNAMLTEAAGPWSADELAERMEFVGADLSNGALRDMAWVSIRSLTDPSVLEVSLSTLAATLAQPAFIEKDFERMRSSILATLQREQENPADIASKAFYQAIYGDHPYASNTTGTTASVQALSLEQARAFHRAYYVARNAVIAMVGDLSNAQARQIAEQISQDLPAGQAAPALPAPKPLSGPLVRHIEHPSSQTHIYLGQPGMQRGDADYFPLYVGNHVFGGSGLVSILSEEVREKRGLSYSVSSYFLPMRQPGPFRMNAQTRNSQAEEAVRVMLDALREFRQRGPTAEELEASQRNISGGFPLTIASNKKIVEYLAMIGFYDLPLDYLDRLVERVLAVTPEQVREAFMRRLDPERLVLITVGQKAASSEGGSVDGPADKPVDEQAAGQR
ncbi:M16 family metallopeptidase [Magnetovirga frankeli]|uniref:M16 family metallopeptidase n=1 Tax=Magnetovirga frankeli TaxID=947516 RepID=UPI003D33B30C